MHGRIENAIVLALIAIGVCVLTETGIVRICAQQATHKENYLFSFRSARVKRKKKMNNTHTHTTLMLPNERRIAIGTTIRSREFSFVRNLRVHIRLALCVAGTHDALFHLRASPMDFIFGIIFNSPVYSNFMNFPLERVVRTRYSGLRHGNRLSINVRLFFLHFCMFMCVSPILRTSALPVAFVRSKLNAQNETVIIIIIDSER